MKTYSKNTYSTKEKLEYTSRKLFNIKLNDPNEGYDIRIGVNDYKAIIQEHTNPYNEKLEDRKFYCLNDIVINRGDLIKVKNKRNIYEDWLIISQVDMNNIYSTCKVQKTNNTVTFRCTDNNIYTLPCLKQSATLYSDGIQDGKTMSYLDDEVQVLVPYNLQTCRFKVGQRFIFDKEDVYKITSFDKSSYMENVNGQLQGVLKIHMARTEERNGLDDFENNLADNSDLIEIPILLEIPKTIIELKVGDTFKIIPTLTKNGQVVTDINELSKISYTTTNDLVATISNDGLITAIANGGIDLFVNYNNQSVRIECYISPTNVAMFSIQLSGAETIKDGRYNIYSMKLYDDKGLEVIPTNTVWELVNVDGIASELAYIYSYDNTICKVKCNSNLDNIGKKFKLKCISQGVYVEELIQIVSAF